LPQLLLVLAGYLSLALAALGVVLPLMPTTVFLLIAAWCFGKASPALQDRLRAHPRFGKALLDWEQHGAVSQRSKSSAVIAMALYARSRRLLAQPTVGTAGLRSACRRRDRCTAIGVTELTAAAGAWLVSARLVARREEAELQALRPEWRRTGADENV
jgi:uncharacterized membrane protein YbaN (DUF454 family)